MRYIILHFQVQDESNSVFDSCDESNTLFEQVFSKNASINNLCCFFNKSIPITVTQCTDISHII